ncbi:MAG TPA: hypothetical protein PKD83_09085, partial [Ignavibacteria bacterium]|nr:hypothetical protein [Ignavibacteria bacterium]
LTETKTIKRIELESAILETSSTLFVLGTKTENEVIKAISHVTLTGLDKLRDMEVINKANSILNSLTENESALVEYGVTADELAKLRNCIANFKTSSIEKSGSSTESIMITQSLRELFSGAMDILEKEIDKFVDAQESRNHEFHSSYYAVRSIKNLGIRHKKTAVTTSGS